MRENLFEQLEFGAFRQFIENDDITDISYTNNGQIWVRSLTKGAYRVENHSITNADVEKLAFQCSNVMGTTFNNASPFLDAESPELRMNFVHESIATNGIALVIRKTPAKIRLKEENLLKEDYITKDIHDFLIQCVHGHCNIMVCGETGSGKTEFVKYLASHTKENEKIITIEDTLELHLDKIYPTRDIVAMKTNNIASYSDVLVTCMRQNPKWILLSEVRSAEAVSAVRNSISSGHNILSTIHSDKASAIPHRMYSLMESQLDVDQFLNTIYRYIQLGVHIKAYYSKKYGKFHREIDEITEFYIDEETNKPVYRVLYQKTMGGKITKVKPSDHLINYLLAQNIDVENMNFDDEDQDSGLSFEEAMEGTQEKKEPETLTTDNQSTPEATTVPPQAVNNPTVQGMANPTPTTTAPVSNINAEPRMGSVAANPNPQSSFQTQSPTPPIPTQEPRAAPSIPIVNTTVNKEPTPNTTLNPMGSIPNNNVSSNQTPNSSPIPNVPPSPIPQVNNMASGMGPQIIDFGSISNNNEPGSSNGTLS